MASPGSGSSQPHVSEDQAAEGTVISKDTHSGDFAATMVEGSQSQSASVRVGPDAPRTQFGRYRILKELGRGAMGAVYLAHDEQLDREIALKVPQFGPEMDPTLLERFYREARAAAQLRHPGICPVHDVGDIDGQHYITMAFIKGRPLRDFSKSSKQQGLKQIIRIIRKLAIALAVAHKHSVVHRDLKPANIMIDESKEPVVMDFGLARRSTEREQKLTHSGTAIGTPAYMSPEQVDGDNERIGPTADIYSLGVIFYELLTGQLPFQGNLMSILKQIATEDPRPPSELRPGLPPELEAICLKMMARDMQDRYQFMEQVTDALTAFLKAQRAGIEESGTLETSKPPRSRRAKPVAVEATEPAIVPPMADAVQVSTTGAFEQTAIHPLNISVTESVTQLPTATVQVQRRRPNRTGLWIGGAVVVGLALLAGIVLFVKGRDGTLRIQIRDPGVSVSVQGDDVRLSREGQHDVTLTPGNHTLHVTHGDLQFDTDSLSLTSGDTVTVVVELLSDKVQVTRDGRVVGERAIATTATEPVVVTPVQPPEPQEFVITPEDDPVDILGTITAPRDLLDGDATRDDDGNVNFPASSSRVCQAQIPVEIHGDYRLTYRFTVNSGNEWVAFIIPVGPTQARVVRGSHNNNRAGLGMIDGKPHDGNGTTRRHTGFTPGKSYVLTIEVRCGEEEARVNADLDGAKFVSWFGPHTGLKTTGFPEKAMPGFGTTRNITMHEIALQMLSGEAKLKRIADKPKLRPATQPDPQE